MVILYVNMMAIKNQWWASNTSEYFTDSLKAVQFASANDGAKQFVYTAKDGKNYFGVACKQIPYYAEGILGQFIYIDPRKNIVVLRLGHYWKHPKLNEVRFIKQVATMID